MSDRRVFGLYGDDVLSGIRGEGLDTVALTFPGGDRHKTRQWKRRLEDGMFAQGVGRETAVVAVGGGVTTDLAGFVSSTYMRGIAYLNVPTTLLAMVDAAVGGKTAVNTRFGKNLVGTFHQPHAVLADLETLRTLSRRELRNGLAEMVKHAMIADVEYLKFLDEHAQLLLQGDPDVCGKAVVRSVEIKAGVVAADTQERDLRQVLNFGHTVGHALEKISGYRLSHGHAVAMGMMVESEIAIRLGLMPRSDRERMKAVLKRLGLPVGIDGVDGEKIADAMKHDKKVKKCGIVMALPRAAGRMARTRAGWGVTVDRKLVVDAVNSGTRPRR